MRHFILLTISLVLAIILTGCMGPASIKPLSDSKASAAYGNISIPNRYITNVMLFKVGEVYAPPFKSPPTSHTYTNGNFFFENLAPGKYYLMGFMSGQQAYYFNYQGIDKQEFIEKVAIDIKPGSVTYLGSYQVTGIEKNIFSADTFEIKPSSVPTRSHILTHLEQAAKGTGWDRRFAAAMPAK